MKTDELHGWRQLKKWVKKGSWKRMENAHSDGLPDGLVIFHPGRHVWLECKELRLLKKTKRWKVHNLRPSQEGVIRELRRLEAEVYFLITVSYEDQRVKGVYVLPTDHLVIARLKEGVTEEEIIDLRVDWTRVFKLDAA